MNVQYSDVQKAKNFANKKPFSEFSQINVPVTFICWLVKTLVTTVELGLRCGCVGRVETYFVGSHQPMRGISVIIIMNQRISLIVAGVFSLLPLAACHHDHDDRRGPHEDVV